MEHLLKYIDNLRKVIGWKKIEDISKLILSQEIRIRKWIRDKIKDKPDDLELSYFCFYIAHEFFQKLDSINENSLTGYSEISKHSLLKSVKGDIEKDDILSKRNERFNDYKTMWDHIDDDIITEKSTQIAQFWRFVSENIYGIPTNMEELMIINLELNEVMLDGLKSYLNSVSNFIKESKPSANNDMLAEDYYQKGYAAAIQKEYDNAELFFKKSIELNPDSSKAYYSLGSIFEEQGNYNNSIKNYKEAVKINPNYFEAFNNLGNVYGKLGKNNDAIKNHLKAIQINPTCSTTYFNLGHTYRKKGYFTNAISCYKKVVELNPDYSNAYYSLGCVYLEQGDNSNAIKSLQKSAELGSIKAQDLLKELRQIIVSFPKY